MAEPQKSDAMKAAEGKGFQTNPHKAEQPASTQQQREVEQAKQQLEQARQQQRDQQQPAPQQPASTVPGSRVGHTTNTGFDRVTASRSTDIPNAMGCGTVDLYDLQNIYASLRDGNYYQAFKQCIATLNAVFNPDVTSSGAGPNINLTRPRASASITNPQHQQATDDCCDSLQDWCERHQDNPQRLHELSQERGVNASIDLATLAQLIQLVLQLVAGWKQSSQPQQAR